MNKLLRTVKLERTARKLITSNTTVFMKKTYGYKQNGEVSRVLVNDVTYEIYEGFFYGYQQALRENQIVERLAIPIL